MGLVDFESLAKTAENVNHAYLFDQKITRSDARETAKWITARYCQDIPERIRNAAKPDPRWFTVPKSFNLTHADRQSKPKTSTGETITNASFRMVHSREATRALFILGGTGPKVAVSCRYIPED